MKHERGLGLVFRPKYRDQKTGKLVESAIFWIQFNVHGKRYRESSDSKNRNEAVRLLKRRLSEAGSGRPFGHDLEKTVLADLTEMVFNDYRANGRRLRPLQAPLAHLTRYFGPEFRAMDITSDRLTAYIANRQDQGAANATINRSLAALKRAFVLAERAGKVARRPHVAMLEEQNRRKGFFEYAEYRALADHLPEYLKPVFQMAYTTGWRITSEILTRQKHHVDLEAGWLRLEPGETKNGEGRMFPLTPELREVLEHQLERTRKLEVATGQIIPWLFHNEGKPIRVFRRAWVTACKKAGLPGRIPHDFRRTAVRNLERAGISRSAAMAMVGHKTQSIYQRYAIADEATLKEAAVKLATLDGLQNPAAPRVVELLSAKVLPK